MTAEIAILSKHAVALAADSAVTVAQSGRQKVYTSANKIFALSRSHPVGIMIYGSASFTGVPWETMIKSFRSSRGNKSRKTLALYAEDFLNYLNDNTARVSPEDQRDCYMAAVVSYFVHIAASFRNALKSKYPNKQPVPEADAKKLLFEVISDNRTVWLEAKFTVNANKNKAKDFQKTYGKNVSQAIDSVFANAPLAPLAREYLEEIASLLFIKSPDIYNPNHSGVAIAGFGDSELYPSLFLFQIDGYANGCLQLRGQPPINIGSGGMAAAIVPLAQSDAAQTFLTGIDPDYRALIERDLRSILSGMPQAIIDRLVQAGVPASSIPSLDWPALMQPVLTQYLSSLKTFRESRFQNPIVDVVRMLPKDELAAVAEALVNLTSFKRRLSMDAETVGGPVDVALISKGDGLIWMKRKHYFKPELNSRYFHISAEEARR